MRVTRTLLQQRQPMIRFLGRRHTAPPQIDHSPQPHPASPTHTLPNSFAEYRKKAQQHGPLGNSTRSSSPTSTVSGRSGHSLGSLDPSKGEAFDRSELPRKFQRTSWTAEEIEAIDSGGASMWS